jgi:rhodanese-related sulfurtransferase
MAPFVPHYISDEFSLVVALLVGIGFGFVLEQAGFSSTKKLVGLFYGYDFTVLRVFFTAGVTAMAGVLLLGHYGLLDLSLIYVNPTFLRSAIVGGLVMGAGFIVGGFCPGTSVCAAAVGKLDAMVFLFGSVIGIFAFAESYPLIKDFYVADNMGPLMINDFFGISPKLFGLLLTIVALAAFYFTWKVELKINKRENNLSNEMVLRYAMAAFIPFIVLAVVTFLPNREQIILNKIAEAKRQQKCVFKEIEADNLAYEIVNHYYQLNVIDVRSTEEFEAYHLPLAINIPFDEIMDRKWENIFKQTLKKNVFYADSDTLVRMACLKAKFIGRSDNQILRETVSEFKELYSNIKHPGSNALKKDLEVYHFRTRAAMDMENLSNTLKNIGKPVQVEMKIATGGCS